MKRRLKIILFCFFIFFLYIGALYLFQNNLLFYPNRHYKSPKDVSLPMFLENIIVAADNTSIMTWYFDGDYNKPAILFLHGNAGQIATFAPYIEPIAQSGYSVLLMEYRGFGNTKGTISQKNVVHDAILAFDWLKKKGHDRIVVYGYSFGAAFSCALSSERNLDGLILVAPFSSLRKLVSEKPVPFAELVLKDDYLSVEYLKKYKNPLLLIHGKKDALIPYHHTKILFDAALSEQKYMELLDNETHPSIFFGKRNIPFILKFLEQF